MGAKPKKGEQADDLAVAEMTRRIDELQRELWRLLWERKRLLLKKRWADPAQRDALRAAMRVGWDARKHGDRAPANCILFGELAAEKRS